MRRSTRPVTETERAEMVRLYEQCGNMEVVAQRLDRRSSTIYRHLRSMGIVTAVRRNRYSPQQEESIAKLYEAGFSTREIGNLYDMHFTSVNYLLRRHGVQLRRPYGYEQAGSTRVSHERLTLAQFLYEREKMGTTEIGEIMGVSAHQIRRYLRHGGVQLRPQSEAVRLGIQRVKQRRELDKPMAA